MSAVSALVSPETKFLNLKESLALECGKPLPDVRVAYRTWGKLNLGGTNAVLVCHALTGSADVDQWWPGLLGPGRALDPRHDFIVCSNVLGSCYGTTGPASIPRGWDGPWGPDFPEVTIRDMVRLQKRLLEALGVNRLQFVIGGSMGGMQVLEWALLYPEFVEAIVPIAVSGRHSAWCIGLSEAQRQAIFTDPHWQGGRYREDEPPVAGLAAARMVAMCAYRSRASFETRFGRERSAGGRFRVQTWLLHHGEQLVRRFDANTYVTLTKAMDTHDIARGRGSYESVLSSIPIPAEVIAVDSDVLYPLVEQEELANAIPDAGLSVVPSEHGHDAFLIEQEEVNRIVSNFRAGIPFRMTASTESYASAGW